MDEAEAGGVALRFKEAARVDAFWVGGMDCIGSLQVGVVADVGRVCEKVYCSRAPLKLGGRFCSIAMAFLCGYLLDDDEQFDMGIGDCLRGVRLNWVHRRSVILRCTSLNWPSFCSVTSEQPLMIRSNSKRTTVKWPEQSEGPWPYGTRGNSC